MPIYRSAGGRRKREEKAEAKAAALKKEEGKAEEIAKKKKEEEEEEKKRKKKARKVKRAKSATGRIQGNSRKQRLQAENWARSKTDSDIPTLRQEQKSRLNQMLNDMYADDFVDDMGMLFVLLKKLEVDDGKLLEYEQVLLDYETRNVETTFSKRFDLLGGNRKTSFPNMENKSLLRQLARNKSITK